MADRLKHPIEKRGGHDVDQLIIQTPDGIAGVHHSIHQQPSGVVLDFRQGIQIMLVFCPGGTAGDELE